jgi:arylsulfatase A-like enzyme
MPESPPRGPRLLTRIFGPSLLGALYFAVLSIITFAVTLSDDRVNGVHAPAVQQLIATEFRSVALSAMALVLSVSVLMGVILGAAAGLVVRAIDWLACRPRRASLGPWALGLVVVFHAFAWAHDIALRPQLYEGWLYGRGGLGRWIQLLLTHVLGCGGVIAIGVTLAAVGLALALRPWSQIRRIPWQKAAIAAGALAVASAALLFWSGHHPARAKHDRPNVVLIVVDSLRADRLTPEVMPRTTALADRGTRFDRAFVPLPRTFPSWLSMLTGRYPHDHGIRHMFPRWEARERDFAAAPRFLEQAGYRTVVVSDFAGDIFRRADLGFERVVAPTFNLREVIRERIVEAHKPLLPLLRGCLARWALPVLREVHTAPDAFAVTQDALGEVDRAPDRPFLLTLFYSTPHFPYSAPSPYYARFADPSYRGRFLYSKAQVLGQEAPPDAADIRQIRALFDGAVAASDAAIGELVDGLAARGLLEDTVVIITADHGEGLYEAGRGQGHGDHLFGSAATAVPLVIVDPRGGQPHRVSQVVSLVDLGPTLCDLAGVICAADVAGRSLAPLVRGGALSTRPVFAETGLWFTEAIAELAPRIRFPYPDLPYVTEVVREHGDEIAIRAEFEPFTTAAKHRMVRDERYKLIYLPARQGVTYQLFDTVADPDERQNLIDRQPEVADRLKRLLWQWMLEDTDFERSGEYLLPRPGRLVGARALARGMRIEEHVK